MIAYNNFMYTFLTLFFKIHFVHNEYLQNNVHTFSYSIAATNKPLFTMMNTIHKTFNFTKK